MMDEYIKREDALAAIRRYGLSNGSALGRHSGAIECAINDIENLPAADVAPVVRLRSDRAGLQHTIQGVYAPTDGSRREA